MKLIFITILTILPLFITSCGEAKTECSGLSCNVKSENKSESYSYEYTYNFCATGKHEFSSKQGFCDGLKDNALNKGCALDMRKDRYTADCGADWANIY